jgi:hypothetical protein
MRKNASITNPADGRKISDRELNDWAALADIAERKGDLARAEAIRASLQRLQDANKKVIH